MWDAELELPKASFGDPAVSSPRPVAVRTGLAAGVPLSMYAITCTPTLPEREQRPLPAVTPTAFWGTRLTGPRPATPLQRKAQAGLAHRRVQAPQ